MKDKEISIYLAGPFFNPSQVEVIKTLEEVLGKVAKVYSPSRDGIKLDIKTSTYEDREAVFQDNVINIVKSDLVVAVLDWYDTGTYWEIGYAQSLGKHVLAVYKNWDTSPIADDDEVGFFKDFDVISYEDIKSHYTSDQLKSILVSRMPSRVLVLDPINGGSIDFNYANYKENLGCNITKVNPKDINLELVNISKYDLVVGIIDERDPMISRALGYCYELGVPVVTVSSKGYGINIMLLHSVIKHYTDPEKLFEELRNGKVYEKDDTFVKGVKDFE